MNEKDVSIVCLHDRTSTSLDSQNLEGIKRTKTKQHFLRSHNSLLTKEYSSSELYATSGANISFLEMTVFASNKRFSINLHSAWMINRCTS